MSALGGAPERLESRLAAEIPGLRVYLGRLAGRDGEDLVQDVLARALRYRDAFDGRSDLAPWLRRIGLRVWIDQRRRASRTPLREPMPADLSAAAGVCVAETRDELEQLLAPLSQVERAVLTRFHGAGQSVREISAALAMPEGTVKSHLHRARRALADDVGGERDV
jgi:RNA polymerase sigma-70 factor (ECF subfamily)